jgi:hypothetical protein
MRVAYAALALVLLASPAFAGPPLQGVYTVAGGDILDGRFSESWVGGYAGQLGNSVRAQSWDGVTLGAEWGIACVYMEQSPVLVEDNVDEFGNGTRVYRTEYEGGGFGLAGTGPWGGGDANYTGVISQYVHITTITYAGGEHVSYTTDVEIEGSFDGYETCMNITAQAASVGRETGKPADYPAYFVADDSICEPWGTDLGEWGDVVGVELTIFPCGPTAVELDSWGMIKAMYR